jgi:ABC-type Fe3+/spermidine/putrescine transport system ATPase subunit
MEKPHKLHMRMPFPTGARVIHMTSPSSLLLRLSGLSKSFGPVTAVEPLDLDVAAGDFCAILGPSGCGKSTLLRMIAGFIEPSTGRVEIEGRDVTRLGPEKRPTNMVFQSYGLFPHLNVAENIGFGLALQKRPREEIAERVAEALRLVRLDAFGERMIDRLSGGQQQRVALARALIMRPKVLLLDEPLAALDLKLRHQMQEELRRIHSEIGGTFIFVTHDQGEAFALANLVAVMNQGKVEQTGSPADIYLHPKTLFVADFVGETSLLEGERRNGRVRLKAGLEFDSKGADGAVRVVVRPERVQVRQSGLEAVVSDTVFFGSSLKVVLRLPSDETLILRSSAPHAVEDYKTGTHVTVGWGIRDQQVIDLP